MPSSKEYELHGRDFDQEQKTAKARGEQGKQASGKKSDNAVRHEGRRKMLKLGLVKPGQDVDHTKPLSKGGSNQVANLKAKSPSNNRSFARNSDGSMKKTNA
jgi:hypothetical protein